MKILRLRFTNLNSLRGETRIEFEEGPLSRAGLFAITGPTGAGKTTILDAITLALYGRVARYGNTANPENVMSRHTGEASAELEFACAAGRFRCLWLRQRARKKPEGRLQQPKRQVIALPSGDILCEKIADTDRKVCELTGLDYDRFLRSVLLAQGDFAAFLKAGPKERTELLQELTGTGIYQEISAAAFRRAADAKLACEALRREHETVQVLDEDTRQARKEELAGAEARVKELAGEIQSLSERLRQAERRLGLEKELQELQQRREKLGQLRLESAAPLDRLAKHEQALPLRSSLDTLARLESEQARDRASLEQLTTRLPGQEQGLQSARLALAEAGKAITHEETRQEAERLVWAEVEELDRKLAAAKEAGQQLRKQADNQRGRLANLEADLVKQTSEHQTNLELRRLEADWLAKETARAGLSTLVQELQAIQIRWSGLEGNLTEARTELERATVELKGLRTQVEEARATLPSLQERCRNAEEQHRLLEAEQRGHSADGGLEELEQLTGRLTQTHGQLLRHGDAAKRLRELSAAHQAAKTELASLVKQLAEAKTDSDTKKQAAENALQLMEARRQNHELLKLLQSLEQHRSQLVDGRPCPLCGAEKHPYASPGALPSPELDRSLREFHQAEEAYYLAADQLTQTEKAEARLQSEVQRWEQELPKQETVLAEALAAWENNGRGLGVSIAFTAEQTLDQLIAESLLAQQGLAQKIATLRALQKQIQAAEGLWQAAKEQLVTAEATLRTKEQVLLRAEAELEPKHARVRSVQASLEQEQQAFANKLLGQSTTPTSAADARICLTRVQKDLEEWNVRREKLSLLDKQLEVQVARLETLRKHQQEEALSASKLGEQLEGAQHAYRELLEQRRARFGEGSPAEARKLAAETLKRLNEQAGLEARRESEARLACESAMREHQTLRQGVDVREQELRLALEELSRGLSTYGFSDKEAARAALLEEAQAAPLRHLRKELEEENTRLEALAATLQTRMEELPARSIEDKDLLESLREELRQLAAFRDEANRRAGQLAELLGNDEAQRRRQASVMERIETGRAEYLRWESLNGLIGSADGAVFSRFAQGLTLDRLALLANRHLSLLNPRYTLRRMQGEGGENLELEILDLYQASVARPMNSLSGGESFLASLALALALSELAGGKTRIESLFIDEGFGTLDADSLETAMAALENLQAGGKTIGLISHVPSMRERIPTQIQVTKKPGGLSEVQVVGP